MESACVPERSPLAGRTGDLALLGASEPSRAQIDVRVRGEGLTGLEANTWTADGDLETIWLGPDQRLVVGPPAQRERLLRDLNAALAGRDAAIVDVSSMRTVIELAEGVAAQVLPAGCGLDLDPVAWRPGMCAQTLLAKVPVLLQRCEGPTRVFVRASFSEWLLDWMLAVRE
jgi:sarcosine oxidase subunit gamma